MKTKLLFLLTRTPLHVGAGSMVSLIDQPIQRERHTGFPLIPGASLKGAFAARWSDPAGQRQPEGIWLFGAPHPQESSAGAVQFSEGRLLAFPMRSARGSFAWITCPLILRRFARDGGLPEALLPAQALRDDQALFAKTSPVSLVTGSEAKIVLEDYALSYAGELPALPAPASTPPARTTLGDHLKSALGHDPVWRTLPERLAVISDGLMSFFCQSACEIAHHVTLDDDKGVIRHDSMFTQENVPAESMFYACLHFFEERNRNKPKNLNLEADKAFAAKLEPPSLQIGADASTGLGFCTVAWKEPSL
jgi:CRISPR-associated protein Cmr4